MIRAVASFLTIGLFLPATVWGHAPPSDASLEEARRLWKEGAAAFSTGNYELARQDFTRAYSLVPQTRLLQSLGEAELRTGRKADAARHLSQFLRASPGGNAAVEKAARVSLQEAAEDLGSMTVDANVHLALVVIDGEEVGQTPLTEPWYVVPGEHDVVLRAEGYRESRQRVATRKGEMFHVLASLVATAEPAATSASAPPLAARSVLAMPSSWVRQHDERARLPSSPSPVSSPPRGKAVVVVTGTALTLAALGVGVIYAIKRGRDQDEADAALGKVGSDQACSGGGGVVPAECLPLQDAADRLYRDRKVEVTAFVGAAGVGLSTLLLQLLWRESAGSSARLFPLVLGARGSSLNAAIAF